MPIHKSYLCCLLLLLAVHPGSAARSETSQVKPTPQAAGSTDEVLNRIAKEVEAESVADKSYEELAKILEKQPNNFRARILLGNSYDILGMPEEAYEQYQLALKAAPNEPTAIVGMIKAETKTGRMHIAEALVKDALKRFPNNPEVKFWAGNFLFAKGQVKEAEAMFATAITSNKAIFGLPSALAVIRYQQKRYDEALFLAKKDLAKDPTSVLANELAGMSLMKLHRYSEAAKPLAVAFNANPLKSIMAEEYAQALYWKGNYTEALRPALVAMAATANLYSNDAFAKNVVGRILRHVNKKQLAEAISEVSGKLGIDKSAAFHFALGDVLDKYRFRELAIQQYKRGLEIEPGFGRAWYRLALDLENYAHDYPEALRCLKKANVASPEDQTISKHLLRLEDRYTTYGTDWAWQLKEWLRKHHCCT